MPDILSRLRSAYIAKPASALAMLPELFQEADEGKIMELPYRLGKLLFWIDENEKPSKVKMMFFMAMFRTFYLGVTDLNLDEFVFADKVYETRESAEAALKERES